MGGDLYECIASLQMNSAIGWAQRARWNVCLSTLDDATMRSVCNQTASSILWKAMTIWSSGSFSHIWFSYLWRLRNISQINCTWHVSQELANLFGSSDRICWHCHGVSALMKLVNDLFHLLHKGMLVQCIVVVAVAGNQRQTCYRMKLWWADCSHY